MVKPRFAIPLANAVLGADFVRRGGEGGEGRDGLDAAVEGRGVDAFYGRREGREMRGELVGLRDAVAGEGRVARYAGGRGD